MSTADGVNRGAAAAAVVSGAVCTTEGWYAVCFDVAAVVAFVLLLRCSHCTCDLRAAVHRTAARRAATAALTGLFPAAAMTAVAAAADLP